MLEALRRGAFDWVAAEAAGIHRRTFYRWMRQGETGEEPYRRFAEEVLRARAQARLEAEQQVRERDPLSWLRLGPGRERWGEPGWTLPGRGATERPVEEAPAGDDAADLLAALERELNAVEALGERDAGRGAED